MTSSPRMLGDRYELGAVVGRGGTADVFAAFDHVLQREVAVKLLRDATEVDRARFASEVRLMRMLHHPNVVSALDTGTDGGRPWLVLELVEGIPLDVVMGEVPVEGARVAAIGAQVAGALAHAHAHGIVHRDVKPSNVLIAPGDRAKLTDFGIARRTDSASVTLTGHTIGTAAYLAPEQVAGEPVSEAADVYALGLVLLEAVTGRREYDGPPVEAALARLQRSPAVPTSLPSGWSGLISTMTTREPTGRPTASEVASRLSALAEGSAGAGASVTQPTALISVGRTPVAPRNRTAMAVVCSAAAGFVLAATLLVVGGADDQPASASETAPSTTATSTPRAKASANTPKPASSVPGTAAAATTMVAPVTKRPATRQQTGTRQDRASTRQGTVGKKKAKANGAKGKQRGSQKAKSGKGRG
ncbi:serine/threonine-protein kinase [Nocardioides sp.]|uniref:serine/threonine-protein kinase n=1 Tax=Nocardioides sp. TaxID=35761 RepID=UPI002C761D7C|nr:serine/threonine-protein kinase [Nocardioides sp.]HXH78878.1 serine/threonine-protein kinase [Nocardioides sp.]